jgi:ATP-dependent helicase HrpB
MARLGLHPRLAHMILAAKARGLGRLACDVAAILSERDLFRGPASEREADLRARVAVLRGDRSAAAAQIDRGALNQARALARQWARLAEVGDKAADDVHRAGEVVALAYPDRVAQARVEHGQFRLANGRGAVLPAIDALAAEPFLAVAALDGAARSARIFLAAPIDRATIDALFADRLATVEQVAWDSRSESVIANRELRLGALVLEAKPASPDPTATAAAMAAGIKALGLAALPWNEQARGVQARVAFLRRLEPERWPDLSDAALAEDPLGWLGERLAGVTRRAHLTRLDLAAALLDRLDWQQRRALDRLAPTHVPVPSGRQAALDYSGETPALAIKLQEMFGASTGPSVADGRVAVQLQLLSPAGRPVQVTQDLAGFWRNGYAAVRAELRGRYPRHPWPEDPLTAPPRRGVTPRRSR